MDSAACRTLLSVRDYNLAATLDSGQAFRWVERNGAWEGVIDGRWIQLAQTSEGIVARTCAPVHDWRWLERYLQSDVDLDSVQATFPDDEPMRASVVACRGLRLLRQDPWECLASFMISSTKQIVQIRQIVALLCERFGTPVPAPEGCGLVCSFPSAERLAAVSEAGLRACKMGFRAPNVLAAAREVVAGNIELNRLGSLSVQEARGVLMQLRGVGEKIANCVLLFAYGFQQAFPVDVWVMKALRELYFPRRAPGPRRLRHFVETHFGLNAGYAQQYLFHYMRTRRRGPRPAPHPASTRRARSRKIAPDRNP